MIAFLADTNDQFNFAEPVMRHLASRGHAVQRFATPELYRGGIEPVLQRAGLAWFEWGNGYALEASRLPKHCPMVVRVHRYEVFQQRMHAVDWSKVDDVVFVHPAFLDVYNELAGHDLRELTRVHVIPNPVPEDLPLRDRSGRDPGRGLRIAHVSRFHNDKNPALALQILAALVRHDPRCTLHMVGRVQDYQLYLYCMDFVRRAGLQDNFVYEGVIDDVPAWLDDKDAVLATSVVESQGVAVMEAMMMGLKPVVHAGFGDQGAMVGEENVFYTVDQAVGMLLDPACDSAGYRERIASRFGASVVLPRLAGVVERHVPARAGESGRRRSLLNLARHYRERGDEARYREYMAKLELLGA
jgi:glycosyltransferase involved in cell wall biosynthesis